MSDDIRIRPAREEDIPRIAEIYAPEVREGKASFEEIPPDAAEMAARWRKLQDAGYPYFVAELDGAPSGDTVLGTGSDSRVVGYAYASAYRTRHAYRFSVEDSVYVARWARGRGVAGRLLDALVAECTEAGFRQMVAIIGDSDNQGSIRLHEAKGFARVGTLSGIGWKHGTWVDTIFYQRPLGPGTDAPPE